MSELQYKFEEELEPYVQYFAVVFVDTEEGASGSAVEFVSLEGGQYVENYYIMFGSI